MNKQQKHIQEHTEYFDIAECKKISFCNSGNGAIQAEIYTDAGKHTGEVMKIYHDINKEPTGYDIYLY
jgi:hypothetical protein